jgi:uncharacterized protein YeeX (DUF496 family)
MNHVINFAAKAFFWDVDIKAFGVKAKILKKLDKKIKSYICEENVAQLGSSTISLYIFRRRLNPGKLSGRLYLSTAKIKIRIVNLRDLYKLIFIFPDLNILIDSEIKWNSIYLIIERAISFFKDRIDLYCLRNTDDPEKRFVSKDDILITQN